MKANTQHRIKVFLAIFLLCLTSCSTKKKTWASRQYHNTTAKYNGYFNGNERIKAGVKKLHSSNIDDYTAVLSVFPTGDLKKAKKTHSYMDQAIKKGSVVIQRHSIKIKGKEYCKWIDDNYLMVGKAYFYKGNFDEAIKTFSFIKNEYQKSKICFKASLWLVRGYVEKGDFSSAELELEEILKNNKFPDNLEKELAVVASNYYVKKEDYSSAIDELKIAIKLIKRKRKKVRLNYILAQIYQELNNYPLAQKHYKLVLKSNPEYEMAFNAKMNLARSLEGGNSDTRKMMMKLLKMTKDGKNEEYLDQIYFTIAEMNINSKDTASAIKNYLLSTINSAGNNSQKALSFLALGKIELDRGLYKSAKTHYDSTIFYMDTDFRLYKQANERHLILSDLVVSINIVEIQDSLQMLAKLSKLEQNVIISKIIQQETEKERRAAAAERLKKQMINESVRNDRLGGQFGKNTSGGMWYFYNPATLSFGMSEFRKKWGKRKLEDDWRRKDKKTVINFDVDSVTTDSATTETQNKKDPNYYLSQLPKTKEDFEASDNQIKEALYQLGMIYKESLNELDRSNFNFLSITTRFPNDEQYTTLALYNIYINHLETDNLPQANKIKEELLKKYPHSIYAKILVNPNYSSEMLNEKSVGESNYQTLFSLYNNNRFNEVLNDTESIFDDNYKSKYLLIRALSLIKLNELDKSAVILEELSIGSDKISEEAKHILEAIKDPSNMEKANELAFAGSP